MRIQREFSKNLAYILQLLSRQVISTSPQPRLRMSTTTMHFGPEWMRPKQQSVSRTQPPPPSPPPPTIPQTPNASSYSALVSPAPPAQPEKRDETHPFRYSKEEMLRIYKESTKGGLGLEVERWDGVVREIGTDPVGLRDMGEAEKKVWSHHPIVLFFSNTVVAFYNISQFRPATSTVQ